MTRYTMKLAQFLSANKVTKTFGCSSSPSRYQAFLKLGARLFIGLAFTLAGVGKLPQEAQFLDEVMSYHVLPHAVAWWYGSVLPWLEVGIGVMMLLDLCTTLAAAFGLPLVCSFIVANSLGLLRGQIVCHCFGEIVLAVPTVAVLVIDFILLGLLGSILWVQSGYGRCSEVTSK